MFGRSSPPPADCPVTRGNRYRVPAASVCDAPPDWVWSIARVKGREESAVAGRLTAAGLWTYLPLVTVTHRRIRRINGVPRVRKERVTMAAFPNYVFAACDAAGRDALFDARDVYQVIDVADQRRLVRELSNVQRALAIDSELRVTDWIRAGVEVTIAAGPYRGMTGHVSERRGHRVFVLGIQALGGGTGIEVEFSDSDLERANAA